MFSLIYAEPLWLILGLVVSMTGILAAARGWDEANLVRGAAEQTSLDSPAE